MTLRGYRPADLDAMYDICLKTGDSGDDATGIYTDPRLLGEVFVGPYAAFEPDLAFVVEDDEGVGGYVIGARDTRGFEQSCEREWWPALRERYPENAFPADGRDAKIVRLIHHPGAAAEHIVRDYPSHLHIDLLPRTQGRGYGRALMERLLAALHEAGSPAVHLGVGIRNTRAVGFYRRLGFAVLSESSAGLTMGRHTLG